MGSGVQHDQSFAVAFFEAESIGCIDLGDSHVQGLVPGFKTVPTLHCRARPLEFMTPHAASRLRRARVEQ